MRATSPVVCKLDEPPVKQHRFAGGDNKLCGQMAHVYCGSSVLFEV